MLLVPAALVIVQFVLLDIIALEDKVVLMGLAIPATTASRVPLTQLPTLVVLGPTTVLPRVLIPTPVQRVQLGITAQPLKWWCPPCVLLDISVEQEFLSRFLVPMEPLETQLVFRTPLTVLLALLDSTAIGLVCLRPQENVLLDITAYKVLLR